MAKILILLNRYQKENRKDCDLIVPFNPTLKKNTPPLLKTFSSSIKKGGFMYVRLTYLSFLPEKSEEAKTIYSNEIVSVVKQQKGNLDCRLLEPVKPTDEFISMTVW